MLNTFTFLTRIFPSILYYRLVQHIECIPLHWKIYSCECIPMCSLPNARFYVREKSYAPLRYATLVLEQTFTTNAMHLIMSPKYVHPTFECCVTMIPTINSISCMNRNWSVCALCTYKSMCLVCLRLCLCCTLLSIHICQPSLVRHAKAASIPWKTYFDLSLASKYKLILFCFLFWKSPAMVNARSRNLLGKFSIPLQ